VGSVVDAHAEMCVSSLTCLRALLKVQHTRLLVCARSMHGPDSNSCLGQRLTVHTVNSCRYAAPLSLCRTALESTSRLGIHGIWRPMHLLTVQCQEMLIAAVVKGKRRLRLVALVKEEPAG